MRSRAHGAYTPQKTGVEPTAGALTRTVVDADAGGIAVAPYGRMAKKRPIRKQDTVRANATFYAKRTARGRFKQMVEKRRSVKAAPNGRDGCRAKSVFGRSPIS